MIMKNKILCVCFPLIILLFTISTYGRTIGYTHKPLAAEGCNVQYSITRIDTSYYLIVSVKSDRLKFLNDPQMKIRTFNDEVITLVGNNLGEGSQSAGMVIGNMVYPITEINSTAQFKISYDEILLLKNGVSKIRISMTPMNHDKCFKKDKIGKKLYELFISEEEKEDDF